MNADFQMAMEQLAEVNQQFAASSITPLEHSRRREAALGTALLEMARDHGVRLLGPMVINSRGEYSIQVANEPGAKNTYGDDFAKVLSANRPRTGIQPGAHLCAENAWCWMGHFDVEKMVVAYERDQQAELSGSEAHAYPKG